MGRTISFLTGCVRLYHKEKDFFNPGLQQPWKIFLSGCIILYYQNVCAKDYVDTLPEKLLQSKKFQTGRSDR
jgi:hypothetical protein